SSCDRAGNQIQLSPDEEENVITFRNTIDSDNWLDANAHVKNTFENATTVEAAGGFNVTVNGRKKY
ncbi:MAG: hypothetical protein IJN84_08085, partial [Clostridia bacterium]|nr:hypothetical protein [Clostridia bacterium]